jgi:hypothetical protein
VLDRDGRLTERIPTAGEKPTNLAFRHGDNDAIITEVSRGAVEVITMPCAGLPLFYPKGLAD